jgi:hypothetical protein
MGALTPKGPGKLEKFQSTTYDGLCDVVNWISWTHSNEDKMIPRNGQAVKSKLSLRVLNSLRLSGRGKDTGGQSRKGIELCALYISSPQSTASLPSCLLGISRRSAFIASWPFYRLDVWAPGALNSPGSILLYSPDQVRHERGPKSNHS